MLRVLGVELALRFKYQNTLTRNNFLTLPLAHIPDSSARRRGPI
jgi:hypothetical protein